MQSYRDTKANWPVTLKELIARRDQCSKEALLWGKGYFVILLVSTLALAALNRHSAHRSMGFIVTGFLIYFVILIAGAFLSHNMKKRKFRSYDLYCPSCSRALEMAGIMQMAVATGHCPLCHALLVSDHPSMTDRK